MCKKGSNVHFPCYANTVRSVSVVGWGYMYKG